MRELGWPVPVFLCADGGGDGRKNMPSSRSGYIVCFFKQAQRLKELRARFDRLKKHTIYPEREDGMFFLFYSGDRFCKVLILFKMDTRIVLIFFRVDTK